MCVQKQKKPTEHNSKNEFLLLVIQKSKDGGTFPFNIEATCHHRLPADLCVCLFVHLRVFVLVLMPSH